MEIVVDIFLYNQFVNDALKAAQVYQAYEEFTAPQRLTLKAKENTDINQIIAKIKKTADENKQSVVFIYIRRINGKLCNKYPPYIKPNISVISIQTRRGIKKMLFAKTLELIDYEVETDEYNAVTSAKLITHE